MYIDTGSPVPNIPSKSRGLADENKSFDGIEMIRNKRIGTIYLFLFHQNKFEISIIFSVLYIYIYIHTFHIFIDAKTVLKPNLNIKC